METRRCRANNMNGGMNTAIIEEEKHKFSQTNNSRQDLYTTAFVTPLKTFKQNDLPWPFTAIYGSLQEAKWFRSKNETGFAVSAVCIAAIIFGSLTESTLLGLLLLFQSIAVKLIPYSLITSIFFWTGAFMRKLKCTIWWRSVLSMSFTAELLAELSSRYFSLGAANLIGLAFSSILSLVLGIAKQEYASTSFLFLVAATRFVALGLVLQHAADFQTLFTYISCFFGFCLGYVLKSSNSDIYEVSSDSNDVLFANKIPVIRKRRGSSVDSSVSGVSSFSAAAASRRRTSMPLLGLPNRRVSLTSVDLTTLGEAHGMIADLLADSSLPQSVTGALRIISDMLSPLLQQSFNRNSFSTSLVTVLEKTQVHVDEASVKDQPDLKDDTPLSLKNRLTRQLGVGVRRMSSSYTTTTSATGMPSLDIDYRRNTQVNNQDDRRSRTPSPKANRAKSYAGIYNRPEIRREFVKSRSFCQPSPPDARKNSLLKEQDGSSSKDSIFKTELSCSDSNFIDDNINDNITDDEIFETLKPEISGDDKLSDTEKPVESTGSETTKAEKYSTTSEATPVKLTDEPCTKTILKPEFASPADPKYSSNSSRKVDNLNVLQTVPVRKNSRDESALRICPNDGHLSRRGSGVPMECFTQSDFEQELTVAASPEIKERMDKLLSWEFPIFELSERCHILTQTAYKVFQNRGFFQKFQIPEDVFFRYFRLLESGYHDIPYHNQIHAADVLQGTYYFTNHRIAGLTVPIDGSSGRSSIENDKVVRIPDPNEQEDVYGCLADLIPDLELMALYTASAMHDFDHPGRTNAFLVATLNPKALLYNDRSVLENHHAAAAWALLLSDPANNFLCGLESFDLKRFRFIVVEQILSTDLKKHFDFLTEWNAKVSEQGGGLNWSSEADRLLVGQMCIKLSDISGPSKTWDLHYKWTQRIVEEFYLQGDAEAAQGMPISPYMDRTQPRLPQLQDSFIKHLVGPLYNSYGRAGLLPGDWVENEIDPDDENDDEENYDASSQSFTNDSTSDRSDDEAEIRTVSEKLDKAIEMKKRKTIFCETTNNINRNIERWQQVINAETIVKESENKVAEDEEDKMAKSDNNRQETIEEEEENDNSGSNRE
ncbi:cGMP-inhibited 3',5'-cyclic phosphodiesterase 3A-like isoform X1 [Rhopilema esculentum]|uniref:cGMP-inhibited 3',5'-cyclic phosphodiesterase 3A-like isoform X1 n=1 Tax=Rhopilema esculentum TaxID=499914 RepID=UPI0031DADAE5